MTLADAKTFLNPLKITETVAQRWADLGCGPGLFSHAIADKLPNESHLLCLDLKEQKISQPQERNVKLEFRQADFATFDFEPNHYDGILMANSLHFIQDKGPLLTKLCLALKQHGTLVIIEYERELPNDWVPYPITFAALRHLLVQHGVTEVSKLSERRSAFGSMMYLCQATSQTVTC